MRHGGLGSFGQRRKIALRGWWKVHVHLLARASPLTRRLAQPPSLQHVLKSFERAQGILSTPVRSELVERKVERKIFDKVDAKFVLTCIVKGTGQQYELAVLVEIHQLYGVFLDARSLEY